MASRFFGLGGSGEAFRFSGNAPVVASNAVERGNRYAQVRNTIHGRSKMLYP